MATRIEKLREFEAEILRLRDDVQFYVDETKGAFYVLWKDIDSTAITASRLVRDFDALDEKRRWYEADA